MTKGASLLFAVQSVIVVAMTAAPAFANQDSQKCEFAATNVSTEINELARFFLEVQSMPETDDKSLALNDLKKKHKQYYKHFGDRFLTEFDASIAAQRKGFLEDKTATNNTIEQRKEELLQWTRVQPHPLQSNPHNAKFVSDDELIIPQNQQVILYNLKIKQTTHSWPLPIQANSDIVLTKDRSTAYVSSNALLAKIKIKDLMAPVVKKEFDLSTYTQIALSPDESRIVVGSGWGRLHVMRTSDFGGLAASLFRQRGPVNYVRFSDSGNYVMGFLDNREILLDVQTDKEIAIPENMKRECPEWTDAVFLPGKDEVLAVCSTGNIVRFKIARGHYTKVGENLGTNIAKVRVSKNGKTAIVIHPQDTNGSESITTRDIATGKTESLTGAPHWSEIVVTGETDDILILANRSDFSGENNIMVLDKATLKFRLSAVNHNLTEHTRQRNSVSLSPSGNRMILPANGEIKYLLEHW